MPLLSEPVQEQPFLHKFSMQHLAEDPTNSNAVLGEEDLHLPISEDNREPPSIGGLPSRQVCSRQDHWCEQVDLALQARAHPQRWQTG